MSKGRSDISNFALRAFLTRVGHRYDELRGLVPFKGNKKQMQEVLAFFNHRCCYCGSSLKAQRPTRDHLIPLNRAACGLHAWGNVVPSCSSCNDEKHHAPWRDFLTRRGKNKKRTHLFRKRIEAFVSKYRYNLSMSALSSIAHNLYEDVGAIAMTLIDLRFKQATKAIEKPLRAGARKRAA